MPSIVAQINEEVQKIFEDLTGDPSVLISDVEEQVSAATASWGKDSQRVSFLKSPTLRIWLESLSCAESVKGEVVGIGKEAGVLQRCVVFCVCRDGNINVGAVIFRCLGICGNL